ncbi:MAG TPA: ThiF family adenylyltransferase [Pirellulales bacterium]|jgi:adenylyltransferase/sulfurtransferase|nr:ThiF family adenylyltransferase [Pirellulales bacterium]
MSRMNNTQPISEDRYARQMRYAPLGEAGQQRLMASRALICGCGALGSVIANTLARAGVGTLRIVDRDFLELNNLQRQVLFDEADVASALPKAVAAANKLRQINSAIRVEPVVADASPNNILALAEGCDIILDGTDNFETRYLLNEAAVKLQLPWVYGGCIGAEGQTLTVLPGIPPCFRCVMNEPPPPGTSPTCDTAGILSPIVNVIASIQACEAIKILSGNLAAINRSLTIIDLWSNQLRQLNLDQLRTAGGCATCRAGPETADKFPWLSGERGSRTAVLCGRNSVQLSHGSAAAFSPAAFASLEKKLAAVGEVIRNPYLLRCAVGPYLITLFPDGRAIIGGTADLAEARSVYAKFVGH